MPGDAKFCPACGYATTRLAPGQTLDGKYEILEKIGEGGMGEVYKARHVHLDEIRIIKVTKPDPLGEGPEPRRFQEEARIATLVRHPNVAALYDFSRLPDGSFYMVWEFIDGITLEAWLYRYGPLPAARALDVARQVLSGLSQIHAQGIVHRDLAPDNIMLRESKQGGLLAKIIDLGIAKRVAGASLQMTGTGMFLGKLKYCSPEQAGALPAGQVVDGRSDLYSFGVVLYEMLSGKPPFESQTPEGFLGKHLHSPPPPLDTRGLPAAIAPALSSIVTRALEKQRERRFRDAEEFATALARLTPAATETADAAGTTATGRRESRFPVAWMAAAILLVAAVAAYVVVHREAPRIVQAARSDLPPLASPTAASTPVAADAIVVEPRILESATPVVTPPPSPPRRVASRPSTDAPLPPTAIPAPPTAGASAPAVQIPRDGILTEQRIRRMVEDWTGKPLERRANQAVRLAYVANSWVNAHPDEPFSAEIREMLPRTLKDDAETAAGDNRPGLAMEFYVAYLQLKPTDAEALRRLTELRSGPKAGRRRRFPG